MLAVTCSRLVRIPYRYEYAFEISVPLQTSNTEILENTGNETELPKYDSFEDLELKVFIVQTSISDEHILFKELEEEIKMREESRDEFRGDSIETSSVQQDLQNPEITIQELQEDFTE